MGELWRSKEMTLIQIFLQFEAAHETIEAIGNLGLLQFIDLNPDISPHQRQFIADLRRLHGLEEIITAIAKEIHNTNVELKHLKRKDERIEITPAKQVAPEMNKHTDELEVILKEIAEQLKDVKDKKKILDGSILQVMEQQAILGSKDEGFFLEEDRIQSEDSGEVVLEDVSKDDETVKEEDEDSLQFICGVIPEDKINIFEIVLHRATKGQAYINTRDDLVHVIDPEFDNQPEGVDKVPFVCFYRGKYTKDKISKLAVAFKGHVYHVPTSPKGRSRSRERLRLQRDELEMVLQKSIEQRKDLFVTVAHSIDLWYHYVLKEIAIFHQLNMFIYNSGRETLIAEAWCPTEALPQVNTVIKDARIRSGCEVQTVVNVLQSRQEPPTYFHTNKFTKVFQKIVDSYGTARYREINPAVFTIITFPWQFGIMFGDVGHGSLLLLLAFWLLYKEKDWEGVVLNEMLAWMYKGRYLILLMGLYAFWMGALYNECFAVTMDFGSNWKLDPTTNNTFLPKEYGPNSTYSFGVDPVWKGSSNELLYYNSVKMKMSIIVGVIQMTVGLFLHCLNSIEFRKPLDFFFEFIPRMLFLQAIFGYLCFMIFFKWGTDWHTNDLILQANPGLNTTLTGTNGAPVLLNELIFMFLPGGKPNALYQNQVKVQTAMVILAGISLPWMLIKPLIELCIHKQEVKKKAEPTTVTVVNINQEGDDNQKIESSNEESSASLEEDEDKVEEAPAPKPKPKDAEDEEEFQFGELCIHNLLETIEFVLGSVSHTASYLRLWALSLAHSELATVFWQKIFFQLLQLSSQANINWFVVGLAAFAAFAVWFAITLMVMMFMELLSALLHALRLHWVEFQSKFYKGDGTPFKPLSLRKIHSTHSFKQLGEKQHQ